MDHFPPRLGGVDFDSLLPLRVASSTIPVFRTHRFQIWPVERRSGKDGILRGRTESVLTKKLTGSARSTVTLMRVYIGTLRRVPGDVPRCHQARRGGETNY